MNAWVLISEAGYLRSFVQDVAPAAASQAGRLRLSWPQTFARWDVTGLPLPGTVYTNLWSQKGVRTRPLDCNGFLQTGGCRLLRGAQRGQPCAGAGRWRCAARRRSARGVRGAVRRWGAERAGVPPGAAGWGSRLLLLAPRISRSPCGQERWKRCCDRGVRALRSLGSGWNGHWWSYYLPFPICHLSCLSLCHLQKSLVQGEASKIPAGHFTASAPVGAPEGSFPCGIFPAGSGGCFAAKSFQLFHHKLKTLTTFSSLLTNVFYIQMFPSLLSWGLYLTFSVQ